MTNIKSFKNLKPEDTDTVLAKRDALQRYAGKDTIYTVFDVLPDNRMNARLVRMTPDERNGLRRFTRQLNTLA